MVVVEERGTRAGLRQALRETRRKRGRVVPTRRCSHVYGSPKTPTIYRGGGGAVPPSRVPPQGVRPALDGTWGGGQEGERGEAPTRWALGPSEPRVSPFPPFLCPRPLVGGAPAHLGAGPFPHLAHATFWGRWPHLVDPRDPPGGPGTLPISPETFPVTKTGLPIYKYLPPDHSGTPRDVRDLIRDSEQHSVTTYIYSL